MSRIDIYITLAFVALALGGCSVPIRHLIPKGVACPRMDWPAIAACAERSALAYGSREEITAAAPGATVVDVDALDLRYMVETEGEVQRTTIRGTVFADREGLTLRNAGLDARYRKEWDSRSQCYVHRGFLEAAQQVYVELAPLLDSGHKQVVTGHSLGGAVALLVGLYLYREGYDVQVYTFGQPKVTNLVGAHRHGGLLPLVRIVNARDPVPRVPPLSWIAGQHGQYRHMGAQVTLHKNGRRTYLSPKRATSLWANLFWSPLIGLTPALDVDAHGVEGYVAAVR